MSFAPRLLLLWFCGVLPAPVVAITQQEILDPELRALHERGCAVYHGEHDRERGLFFFKELEALARSKNNTYWWSSGLWKQAQVFSDEGNLSESVRLFENALEVGLRDADYAGTANHLILLRNLFGCYERGGRRGESLRIHRAMIPAAGLNLARSSKLPADTPLLELSVDELRPIKTLAFIGGLYVAEMALRFESGDDDGALSLAERMDRRLAGTTHPREATLYAAVLRNLVNIHLAADRVAEAEQTLLRLIDLGRVPGSEAGGDILAARIDLALLRAGRGAETAPLFAEVRTALDGLANYRKTAEWLSGRGKLSRLHALGGDFSEAKKVIDGAIVEARALDEPRLLADLLITRVDLQLNAGRTDGVRADLYDALSWYRRQGVLRAEAAAGVHYARFLRLSGQPAEASAALARVEASIRRFPDAVLRALLQAEQAALSGPTDVPAMIASSDLQPVELRTHVTPSSPARGRFTVTNPGGVPVTGLLEAEGAALAASWDAVRLEWRLRAGETGGPARARQRVTLKPLDQATIILTSDAPSAIGGKVRITWRGEAAMQTAWWYFATGESVSDTTVIDANLALENPFYSVPLHHHIVRTGADSPLSQNIRVVTDRPCRVELVAAETGRVLAVDATGDGGFSGAGDVIFRDDDLDGMPDLRFAADRPVATLEIQLYPLGSYEEVGARLELRGRDGVWTTGAADRLLGKR
jgi:tetratricopeptide (TPR) repeat protein